eukprot:TRINITY_DN9676_c0_g2_i1.p1 TRINITY_DN9676_c0_g2~~TRINITY_DN9676_c0_g2_i1.p1  ORF type:complete len:125 (+),score=10.49 TRINITY_DN9676_c0_g2_i1:421-795(+)
MSDEQPAARAYRVRADLLRCVQKEQLDTVVANLSQANLALQARLDRLEQVESETATIGSVDNPAASYQAIIKAADGHARNGHYYIQPRQSIHAYKVCKQRRRSTQSWRFRLCLNARFTACSGHI